MERLKKLRDSKNLTQKELADILNVDRTTYVKWETGSSNPSLDTVIKISKFFNVSTSSFTCFLFPTSFLVTEQAQSIKERWLNFAQLSISLSFI